MWLTHWRSQVPSLLSFRPDIPPGIRSSLGVRLHAWLPVMGGCVITQIYMSKTSFVQTPQGMTMNKHRTQIWKRSSISRRSLSWSTSTSRTNLFAASQLIQIYSRMCFVIECFFQTCTRCSAGCCMCSVFASKKQKLKWHKGTSLEEIL